MTDSWKQRENPKHKTWALLAPRASVSAQPSPLAASSKTNRHLDIINPKQLGPRQLMGRKARGDAVPSLSLQPPSLGTHSQPEASHLASSSPVCLCLHPGWGGSGLPVSYPLTMDASPSGTKPGGFPPPWGCGGEDIPRAQAVLQRLTLPASQWPQGHQRGPRDMLMLSHSCPVGAPGLPNAPGECLVPRAGWQVSRSCWCFP